VIDHIEFVNKIKSLLPPESETDGVEFWTHLFAGDTMGVNGSCSNL
jgi:hypothetical protein